MVMIMYNHYLSFPRPRLRLRRHGRAPGDQSGAWERLRPVHLLRVSLLRVLESEFPRDSLSNSLDMRIPTR